VQPRRPHELQSSPPVPPVPSASDPEADAGSACFGIWAPTPAGPWSIRWADGRNRGRGAKTKEVQYCEGERTWLRPPGHMLLLNWMSGLMNRPDVKGLNYNEFLHAQYVLSAFSAPLSRPFVSPLQNTS